MRGSARRERGHELTGLCFILSLVFIVYYKIISIYIILIILRLNNNT